MGNELMGLPSELASKPCTPRLPTFGRFLGIHRPHNGTAGGDLRNPVDVAHGSGTKAPTIPD
jgi:hypothetical protein